MLHVLKNNNFGEIRVEQEAGEVLFCAVDIAKALGYEKPSNAVSIKCKRVLISGTLKQVNGQGLKMIPESDVYRLIFGSKLPSAEKFQDWVFEDALPSLRKGEDIKSNFNSADLESQLAFAKFAIETLNLKGAAALGVVQNVQSNNNLPNVLPHYAVDSSEGESSMVTNSASELLKSHNAGISAHKFNKLCIEHGLLEEKERKSTKGDKIRKYKAITDKGMIYGKNMTSPKNQAEVAPRWYESKFSELLVEIGVSE